MEKIIKSDAEWRAALAITTATRSSLVPDLPTIAESGYPGFESVAVYGFFAPEILSQLKLIFIVL